VKVFLLKAYNNLLPAKENLIKKIKIKEKKIAKLQHSLDNGLPCLLLLGVPPIP
jgi:hypothetical protein